jgi:hypothetical protein
MHTDAQLIEDLGGSAKVASLLGYDTKSGGVQRVDNWKRRGIPPRVKLDHPHVFLAQLRGEQAGQRLDEFVQQAA